MRLGYARGESTDTPMPQVRCGLFRGFRLHYLDTKLIAA